MHTDYSTVLFARPSFLEGVARVMDLGDTLTEFNQSLSPEQADAVALEMDWRAVGQDLWSAVGAYAAQHPEQLPDGEE